MSRIERVVEQKPEYPTLELCGISSEKEIERLSTKHGDNIGIQKQCKMNNRFHSPYFQANK